MHAQPAEIAALLGLPDTRTPLELALFCEKGLPVECLQALAQTIARDEKKFLGSIISSSTLRRRQQRGKLTAGESDLVVRLAAIWIMARDTFGDDEKARRFLFLEHSLLRGRRPVDLARMNAPGAESVEQILGRLRYGTAA